MNEAKTSFPINELARKRWSPRAFVDKPVEKEKLLSMFEAARWSASANNEQPWRFIVGIKPDVTWEKIFSTLAESNQAWNRTVPVLILVCCMKNFSRDGNPNPFSRYDAGQSAAHLSLEAMSQGLYVHQMGGFSAEKCRELFEIPEDAEPITVIATGYRGDPGMLPEKLRQREVAERERKRPEDILYSGKFGKQAEIPEQGNAGSKIEGI